VHAYELYFERLEQAGLGQIKRPDLLVFRKEGEAWVRSTVEKIGGYRELPFIPEEHPRIRELLSRAVVAIESENSLWRAKKMPDFKANLTPQRRLGGLPGLKKSAVVPTVVLKDEDRGPLHEWQGERGIPIHIWHLFFDVAYGLALQKAEELILSGQIEPTEQIFQAPSGATTRKIIYKIYYHHAYLLGMMTEEPRLDARFLEDKNGHVLPYVRFAGGRLRLSSEAVAILDDAASRVRR